jgi:tyrosyl-tRNA synthetase
VLAADHRPGRHEAGQDDRRQGLAPYQFFQHWMHTDDRQVGEMLAKFTLLALEEIAEVVAAHDKAPERRSAQRRLAREVTALVHGPVEAAAAEAASAVLFGASPLEADEATLTVVAAEAPRLAVASDRLASGIDVVDVLAESELAPSKTRARQFVIDGAVRVNDVVAGEGRRLTADDLLHGRFVLVRRGKSAYLVVEALPG